VRERSVNELESDVVKPFYLNMMGMNALDLAEDFWARVVAAGRTVTAGEVRWMLRSGHWRPVVMGAWFSLAVARDSITDHLLAAMSESKGSLTAPPLAVAATLVAGSAAVPAMTNYIDFMTAVPSRADGSEIIVGAAVEYLGSSPSVVPPDTARQWFRDLHEVAAELRDAFKSG